MDLKLTLTSESYAPSPRAFYRMYQQRVATAAIIVVLVLLILIILYFKLVR